MSTVNSLANFGERKALDCAAGVSPAVPLFVALFTTVVLGDGSGTEVTNVGTGYARKAVTFAAAVTTNGVTATDNTNEVLFDPATAPYGTVTHVGVFDSATQGQGNCYWKGALVAAKTIGQDDQIRFVIGAIDLSVD